MLRRIVSFSPSPGPRGSQSKTSGGNTTPASGHPCGNLSLSSHPIKTIAEDDSEPQDTRAEDAELWEGMSMEELKAQCSAFNLDRERMVYKLQELEKERDAGLWLDYRDDRLQVAVDSALASQKRELLAQFSCDQIKALENLRHELQSQFRKQSAQQEAVMRREFAHKMDDVLFEKNSIIENMEINRKNLVEQIRKYTARFPNKMLGSPRSPMHTRAQECPEEPQSSNVLFSQDELVSSLRTVLQDELQHLQAQMLEGMQGILSATSPAKAAEPIHPESLKTMMTEIQDLQSELTTAKLESQTATAMKEKAQAERNLAMSERDQMSAELQAKEAESSHPKSDPSMTEDLKAKLIGVEAECEQLRAELQEVMSRYNKEYSKRRQLHNQLLELKGNIRVFCRLRPLSQREKDLEDKGDVCVSFPMDGQVCIHKHGGAGVHANKMGLGETVFEYDQVFGFDHGQEHVFHETKPLLQSCLDGYNVTMFAYGQTGSGKTFTMEGSHEQPGVCSRAVQELFSLTADRQKDLQVELKVSMMEIYNETVRDLLSGKPNESRLEIKHDADGGIYLPNLTTRAMRNEGDFLSAYREGNTNRASAATSMNACSSRSHLLCLIHIVTKNLASGTSTAGKLYLVDLAGSERISKSEATGDRLKEAQSINKSLSAIGDVISSLQQRAAHVPYRNSKLTFLLSDSLGGQAKVLMFVNASPSFDNVTETLSSLHFAARVRSVELGAVRKSVVSNSPEISKKKLRQSIG